MSSVRDALRGAIFLSRSLLSEVFAHASAALLPPPEREPEWLTQIKADVMRADAASGHVAGDVMRADAASGHVAGDVVLSETAKKMVAEGIEGTIAAISDNVGEETIKPLPGSLAWRERYGDSR